MISLCASAVRAFVICAFLWSCWDAPSLGFYSSRTAWRWSTPAFPSSASEGTVSSWPRPAGTTACGYSGGRSCSRWRCWSTTRIWCKALPSLTTRTPGRGCWLLGPKTRGSACGLCSVRNQRRPERLGFGWRLPSAPPVSQVLSQLEEEPAPTLTQFFYSLGFRSSWSFGQWKWGRR